MSKQCSHELAYEYCTQEQQTTRPSKIPAGNPEVKKRRATGITRKRIHSQNAQASNPRIPIVSQIRNVKQPIRNLNLEISTSTVFSLHRGETKDKEEVTRVRAKTQTSNFLPCGPNSQARRRRHHRGMEGRDLIIRYDDVFAFLRNPMQSSFSDSRYSESKKQ